MQHALPEGAGAGTAPEAGEPSRNGQIETESGEGCFGLAQVGPALATAVCHATRTFLTLSATFLSPLPFDGIPHRL